MAAKSKKAVDESPVEEPTTAPEVQEEVVPQFIKDRESVVADEPEKSFEERTQATVPWQDEDGNQVNQ